MNRLIAPSVLVTALIAALPARAEFAEGFKSPTGNITCNYMEGSSGFPTTLRCDILRKTSKSPPRPRDCQFDYGNAFELTKTSRGTYGCISDTILGPDYRVLPYGQVWSKDGFICFSAESGVTCRNDRGGGFEISRAKQRVF